MKPQPLRASESLNEIALGNVLKGHRAIGHNDKFLEALVTSGSYCETIPVGEFTAAMHDAAQYEQLTIVGSRYRSHEQQQVLANKSARTLVLLMREPANAADPNAVACLMTKQLTERGIPNDTESGFTWVHVGYIPQNTAAKLAPIWPTKNGLPMIVHTTLRESKSQRQKYGVVHLDPTNEDYSSALKGRDLSQFIYKDGW